MFELRDANFSDYVTIAKLHSENWQQNYRGIFSDNFLDNEVEQERSKVWYKRLNMPIKNQQVTVATLHKEIVGFSCLYLDDDPGFGSYLDNLHVSRNQQKSGIGKLLMQECARCVINKGDNIKMYLWVYASNENARKVYERLGAVNFETIEKETDGTIKAKVCRYVWRDISVLL